MSITCAQTGQMARGETNRIDIDWGENTSGEESGALKNGDTVASCVVALDDSPTGSTTPTLGSVTVPSTTAYINQRACSSGEYTTCQVTMGASQTYGKYRLKFTATTTNGYVLPRFVNINVGQP